MCKHTELAKVKELGVKLLAFGFASFFCGPERWWNLFEPWLAVV